MTNSKNFYTSYVVGGLGNQMFQVAHAICEGKKHNVDVKFKPESNGQLQGNNMSSYVDNILKKLKFERFADNLIHVHQGAFEYRELEFPINEKIEFHGYYQSSKYFYGYENLVKELFSPSYEDKKFLQEKYPNIEDKNTLSIHLRRGDYLNFPSIHPTISVEYIEMALKIIGEYSHVFIFSDDLQWAKQNISLKNSFFVDDLKDYEQIWMMSLCNNNILSNSSFSWWGAFLNKHKDKKVLCPSVWFGPDGEKNWEDIYEKDWIKVQVKYHQGGLFCL